GGQASASSGALHERGPGLIARPARHDTPSPSPGGQRNQGALGDATVSGGPPPRAAPPRLRPPPRAPRADQPHLRAAGAGAIVGRIGGKGHPRERHRAVVADAASGAAGAILREGAVAHAQRAVVLDAAAAAAGAVRREGAVAHAQRAAVEDAAAAAKVGAILRDATV